jgi:hypothetical protein
MHLDRGMHDARRSGQPRLVVFGRTRPVGDDRQGGGGAVQSDRPDVQIGDPAVIGLDGAPNLFAHRRLSVKQHASGVADQAERPAADEDGARPTTASGHDQPSILPRLQRAGVHGSSGGPSAESNQRLRSHDSGFGLYAIVRVPRGRPCPIRARRAHQNDYCPRLPTPSHPNLRQPRPAPARPSSRHVTPPCAIGATADADD